MTDIQIKYWDYKEGARHNLVYEAETMRHNKTNEGQQDLIISENIRHNKVTESQGQQSVNENVRHNYATEEIGQIQAAASMMSAQAANVSAAANAKNAETNRLVSASTIKLNNAKAKGQEYENIITNYGLTTKKQLSLVNAESEAFNLAAQNQFKGLDLIIKSSKLLGGVQIP